MPAARPARAGCGARARRSPRRRPSRCWRARRSLGHPPPSRHPRRRRRPAPRITRAGLDPALVSGRGAEVAFLEQEAENAVTTGEKIGPSREAYTLPAEASGRTAVRLPPGQYVEFTLTRPANALTLRYSIPDAPGRWRDHGAAGRDGQREAQADDDADVAVRLALRDVSVLQRPERRPDTRAGGSPSPDRGPVTKPFRPNHFYDEQRLLLDRTYAAGDRVRFAVPRPRRVDVLDLADFELVEAAASRATRCRSSTSVPTPPAGTTPHPRSSGDRGGEAASAGRSFIPPGTYQVNRHIVVDNVTVRGAGNWWTIIKGKVLPLAEPRRTSRCTAPPASTASTSTDGGSTQVHLADFAIESDVRERIDTDQVNGIGGAIGGGSTIENLYLHHTKVGIWLDGPMRRAADPTTSSSTRSPTDEPASRRLERPGEQLRPQQRRRRPGDVVGVDPDVGNTYDHNTVQTPVLANDIAIYGGRDNAVSTTWSPTRSVRAARCTRARGSTRRRSRGR